MQTIIYRDILRVEENPLLTSIFTHALEGYHQSIYKPYIAVKYTIGTITFYEFIAQVTNKTKFHTDICIVTISINPQAQPEITSIQKIYGTKEEIAVSVLCSEEEEHFNKRYKTTSGEHYQAYAKITDKDSCYYVASFNFSEKSSTNHWVILPFNELKPFQQ